MLSGVTKVFNEKTEEVTRGAIEKMASNFAQVAKSSSQTCPNYAYEQGSHDACNGKEAIFPSLIGLNPEKVFELRGAYLKGYNEAKKEIEKETRKRELQKQIFKSTTVGVVGFAAGLLIGIYFSRK